jgi:hypothetical protein
MKYKQLNRLLPLLILFIAGFFLTAHAQRKSTAANDQVNGPTWISDNGNGTFTNPLFYDEFSDPDMIRVGDIIISPERPCIRCPVCLFYIPKTW